MMQNLQKPNELKDKQETHSSHSEAEASLKHAKEPGTNEKVIEKVLEIEKHADQIHDKAVQEAEQLPVRADQDAQSIIEKSRITAQADASKLLDNAKVQEQSADILREAEKNVQHTEILASSNFNRAVAYVIARVIGRE
jgi:V/A-type H+-transporting ATPase subunit G/H